MINRNDKIAYWDKKSLLSATCSMPHKYAFWPWQMTVDGKESSYVKYQFHSNTEK